jgi:hypothetical protein
MAFTCDRCHGESLVQGMSYFNTDRICMDCKKKEKAHPDYQKAVEAEVEACRRGDYNYRGVGLPDGLR